MDSDRRIAGNQLPSSLDGFLNEMQLATLNKMEGFGWMLAFIRRPLFQESIPVLMHPDCHRFGTLEHDGVFNTRPAIRFRQ